MTRVKQIYYMAAEKMLQKILMKKIKKEKNQKDKNRDKMTIDTFVLIDKIVDVFIENKAYLLTVAKMYFKLRNYEVIPIPR